MGSNSDNTAIEEPITMTVDDRGRVTLPKEVRDHLGITANDEIIAQLTGSVLEVTPKPSTQLDTATAGRDSWEETTPLDAGKSLFGSISDDT